MATLAAHAGEVAVRLGAHGTYGRVVFVVPAQVTATLSVRDDHTLLLSMPGAGAVPSRAQGTLNIVSIAGSQDQAELIVRAGSRPKLWQGAGKVVVDVYTDGAAGPAAAQPKRPVAREARQADTPADPPEAKAAAVRSAAPPPQSSAPQHLTPAKAVMPTPPSVAPVIPSPETRAASARPDPAAPDKQAAADNSRDAPANAGHSSETDFAAGPTAATAAAPPAAAPASAVEESETDGLVAARVAPEAIGGRDAILVPFDRGVGAAAFARGDLAHVVFDDSKPVDMAQLKDDPVFSSARISLLPAATHLTLHLAPGMRVGLARRKDGWVVAVLPHTEPQVAATLRLQGGALRISSPRAANTVILEDPQTGGRLLVGTVSGEGPAVVVPHISPDFSLLPSWDGVLVAALSDRLALRAGKEGFSLSTAEGPPLAVVLGGKVEQALAQAGSLTRHFDFLPLPQETGLANLTRDTEAMAKAPTLARFGPRLRAAQDMLALGLDREAAALLHLALREAPDQARNPDANGLLALAEWMAQRGDGAALAASELGDSDEMAMWRAALLPAGDRKAAATLADDWRLLLAYPEPLARFLRPKVADAMMQGGELAAARQLLSQVSDLSLDPQRARALQLDGKTDAALEVLDRIGRGTDRKRAAAARLDAVELRLAHGKITKAEAAEALNRLLYAWRDETREAAMRLRIADLRGQAGAWRPALAILRDTETLYPATHDRVHALEHKVISDLLDTGAASRLSPVDLVTLVQENADLLAEKSASETLAPVLVDKLLALDLPDRADPILHKIMAATESPSAKAALGARLAGLRLDQGDAAGARSALAESQSAGLPEAVAAHRIVLQARALALQGDEAGALNLLAPQGSPEALELQARLREKRRDWQGAEGNLQSLANASLPAGGALTDAQQDLVLRLASAASEAGDLALLKHLQVGDATRLSAGPRAELFAALAQQPVRALADLPRSGREAASAKAVPAALASYTNPR